MPPYEVTPTDVNLQASWRVADGTKLAGDRCEVLPVSTKLIGIGAVVVVGLTAVAGGYAVLRGPAPVAQVIPASVPEVATPTPDIPVPQPESEAAVEPRKVPVHIPTPAPAPPVRPQVAQSAPAAAPAVPAARVEPAPAPSAALPAPTPERYVPELEPTRTPDAPPVPAVPIVVESPELLELTVARHSVIGIRLDSAVSTRTARVEDRISAVVSRDVTVDGRVAIPIGAKLEGTVTAVDVGGKFRERPRLGLRFDTIILNDGTRLSISTDTIFREGDSPSADATAKVGGGAVAGAILGGVLGGKKGAAIGSAAGAAGGAAVVMRSDGEEAALRAGAPLTVRLTADLTILVPR